MVGIRELSPLLACQLWVDSTLLPAAAVPIARRFPLLLGVM
jgi:hypothetical protein